MTAPQLLGYICAALLLQLAIGITISMWRKGRSAVDRPLATPVDAGDASSAAWRGWRDFRVVRRDFEDAACTQCSFYLEPVEGAPLPPFKPGQFLTFSLPVSSTSGSHPLTRCYSLSDQPDPLKYRITVKRVTAPAHRPDLPPGAASTFFHDTVHPGDILKVKAPAGHFHIDADDRLPDTYASAVFIAGGIGITPMMSMLRWCLAEQPERTLHLYYGVRNSLEHAFKDLLEALASAHPRFQLTVVYSRPRETDVQGRDYHHAGHVDMELLRRTLPHGSHHFYLCGPQAMMASLLPALAAWGVPQKDLHSEAFGPASAHPSTQALSPSSSGLAEPIDVQFRRSGRTLIWDGKDDSLLDFAERHGVSVESGCRSGSCGSCETRMISGTVRYARRPDHDVASGHCLLCLAIPESSLIIEA